MKKTIKPVRTTLKLLLASFLLFLICGLFTHILSMVASIGSEEDKEYRWEHLHELTAEENYDNLYDELHLFDLYGEEYQCFWDVTEAWHLYCRYDAAVQAAARTEDPDFQKTCEKWAEKSRRQLEQFPVDNGNKTTEAALLRIKETLSKN